jgi:MFS transporter, PAT family, beta-lactamase induction signal transducer AmpG
MPLVSESNAKGDENMAETGATVEPVVKPKGLKLLKVALQNRKSATMLAFGFSSGLPYALLIGTLNAWLGEEKINLATIGVLSWIGLSYSFKFLWSPLVDQFHLPLLDRLGRRKSWIVLCQIVMVIGFMGLAATSPVENIGTFAIFAVIAALASATQDVAIDAWRIDVADERSSVELLSTIYQFGYRIASLVGGALALVLAARMSWPLVYVLMACLIAIVSIVAFTAPDTDRPPEGLANQALSSAGEIDPRVRGIALSVVGLSWLWAITTIGRFMASMLEKLPPDVKPPSASDFMKANGAWIVGATVLVPLLVAVTMNWFKSHQRHVMSHADTNRSAVRLAMNHLYAALVSPMAELARRLGWGVAVVFGLILTYRLCDNVWGSFAFPFYLDFLHYTNDEVAFASKVFGVLMTIIGISIGGFLFLKLGRMPTLLVGAILPILGNLLYAELAAGGANIDVFANFIGLNSLATSLGTDARMVRLMLAISGENIAAGIAGAAFVAYLSSIVSKQYTAVQYALLSSLTFLIGSLGRGIAGEAFDTYGYAVVFHYTAAVGLIGVVFVIFEWIRQSRLEKGAS